MILPDVKIYQALNDSDELIKAMSDMQTTATDFPMIFNQAIDEQFQATKYAPLIRVNYIGSSYRGSDDGTDFTRPQVLVSFWTKTLAQGAKLFPIINGILEKQGYYRYSDNHELDPDTADQTDKKMYIFRIFVHGLNFEEKE